MGKKPPVLGNLKTKLPQLRRPPAIPTGPRMYRPIPLDEQPIANEWHNPPPGFLTASNSITEWMVYKGLSIIFQNPVDPRQGPFYGGWPDWAYQTAVDGGRQGPGGSVVDFVIYNPGKSSNTIALRIVTEYWHLYAPNAKQASDEMQREALESEYTVIDLYDFDFINDLTGQATILTLKNVLGFTERPNPLYVGTTIRGSRMDRIGS